MKNFSFLIALSWVIILGFSQCTPGEGGSNNSDKYKGLKRTNSGYPYVMKVSNGGEKPAVGSQVQYHESALKNDSLLYSTRSLNSPRKIIMPPVDKVGRPIPPSYEALFLMSKGDSLVVYQDLDTVSNLPPSLTNEDELTYVLEVLDVKSPETIQKEKEELSTKGKEVESVVTQFIDDYKAGKLDGKLTETESGLKYQILKEGSGATPEKGQTVRTHYSGFLEDGTNFDNSYSKGSTFDFPIGQGRVIPAWDEGIGMLKPGAEAILFAPGNLGYGERGYPPTIPPNANLIFYVELKGIGE